MTVRQHHIRLDRINTLYREISAMFHFGEPPYDVAIPQRTYRLHAQFASFTEFTVYLEHFYVLDWFITCGGNLVYCAVSLAHYGDHLFAVHFQWHPVIDVFPKLPYAYLCFAHAPIHFGAIGHLFWGGSVRNRSEEHTSELQSQSNLVCRLLLEKKKKK